MTRKTPLIGAPPAEVPLANAPLVRVIAQVRFPLIASIEKRDFIGPFQEAIRREYPVLRPEQSQSVVLRSEGVVETRANSVWRFHESSAAWRVSLAPDFLAVETTHAYTSRRDLLRRLGQLLEALDEHIDPQVIDRLGLRYIDRITGAPLDDLGRYIQPELLGVIGSALSQHTDHVVSQNVFSLPEEGGRMIARWGLLPKGGTMDVAAIAPIQERSWVLDVDAFRQEPRPFIREEVIRDATALAERIYAFFRWSVTDDFLDHFRGAP